MKIIMTFAVAALFVGTLVAETPDNTEHNRKQYKGGTAKAEIIRPVHFKNFWNSLSQAEKSDLQKLRNEDQAQFRKKIHAKIEKYRQSQKKKNSKAKTLAKQYKNSSDSAQKERIATALREQVKEDFYTNLKNRKKQLAGLKKRLNKLSQSYVKREKNAKLIIDKQVKKLLKPRR
ncbi:MAG: hypothetical protein L3J71_12210 [Victivallaceae bacterium]|nr:hypothetical protein [Victivallaceae bacterium]